VENQDEDSSKVKTHEEILKLFHEVESVETKIKSPDELLKEIYQTKTILQTRQPPVQIPINTSVEPHLLEPNAEIPLPEKRKISFFKKLDKPENPLEEKTPWFSFLKKEKNDNQELVPSPEMETQPEDIALLQSTFVLQLDAEGNLTGFPLKKPPRVKKSKKETGETEEEPVKGIKGKLKKITSRFRRKEKEESESSGGIGEKIKGIFKRKNKE
jgi:hypothetical protein